VGDKLRFNITLPDLAPYQHRSIFSPAKYVAIEASTKSGKTQPCIWWQLSKALSVKGNHTWTAPVYKQSEIAFKRSVALLRDTDPSQRLWSYQSKPMVISLANGSQWIFQTGDDPDSLYGDDSMTAVVDESSRCKEGVWQAIRSTLTATDGDARAIGNIRGRSNWHYQLCRKIQAGQLPGWEYYAFDWRMAVKAGIIKQSVIDTARAELTSEQFAELYENVASDDGGNPFGLQHIAACVCEVSDLEPVAYGVDVAYAQDWTVVVGLDKDGKVCRFHRWQKVPWPETKERIVALTGSVPTVIDDTGVGSPVVQDIQRMRSGVEGYTFTSASKQALMQSLAVAIQGRTVGFPEGPIRAELDQFEFEVRPNSVRYSAPEGFHDDCVVALSLANYKRLSHRPVSVSVVQSVAPAVRDEWGSSKGLSVGYGLNGSRGRGYGGW
jgi:hypothetical protein